MNVSTDLFSATMTEPPRQSPPEVQPPPHATAIETLGGSLPEQARDSLLYAARELQQSGADFEQVKAFVNSELESNGVDLETSHQRSGQLVDLFS